MRAYFRRNGPTDAHQTRCTNSYTYSLVCQCRRAGTARAGARIRRPAAGGNRSATPNRRAPSSCSTEYRLKWVSADSDDDDTLINEQRGVCSMAGRMMWMVCCVVVCVRCCATIVLHKDIIKYSASILKRLRDLIHIRGTYGLSGKYNMWGTRTREHEHVHTHTHTYIIEWLANDGTQHCAVETPRRQWCPSPHSPATLYLKRVCAWTSICLLRFHTEARCVAW